MAEFIYKEVSVFIATRVRVKNWVHAGEASVGHLKSSLVPCRIDPC